MGPEVLVYEDEHIAAYVTDEKGAGGARHEYRIEVKATGEVLCEFSFQNGNRLENGINGVTNEVLLAIVGHRCTDFMEGPFPSDYTENARRGTEFALANLETRTVDRKMRGVEGQEKA